MSILQGITYADDDACRKFEQKQSKVITNGDKIRQMSNVELAKIISDCGDECGGAMCKYCNSDNCSGQSCIDGIEAWLNAPADDCVKQNGNHDTQTDLCEADNMTVFEKITASPEVLAEKLVYHVKEKADSGTYNYWRSTISCNVWLKKSEALTATMEKLKEVCDD